MRIAQLCPEIYRCPPDASGGTERVVHDLAAGLVDRGHEVTVFAAAGSSVAGRLVATGEPIADISDAPPGLPGAREAIMLDRIARMADEFDIIHCHTEFAYAAALRPWAEKVVTTVHWRADEADRQVFFRHFDWLPVVAISRAQASQLPQEARIAGIVPHGIDPDRYRPGRGEGGHVAFLGRMTDQKGPDRAIDAARSAGLPIRLAGDIDVGNPRYFDERVRPRLGADATFVGPVGDREKGEFLGDASVLAFPIDWPEPFGLVMIEAMACGTPCVAYPCGAATEVIDEGVTGYLARSPEEFADALVRARTLDRGTIRQRFEERFTRSRMAEGYEEIFGRMVSGTLS